MSFSADKTKPKTIDIAKHSRRGGFGKPKLPSDDVREHCVREHCVSVRLNKAELTQLDSKRGGYRRGEWLRMAALHQLAPVLPEVNKEAWAELARSAANLNQITKHLNTKAPDSGISRTEMFTLKRSLDAFRDALFEAQQKLEGGDDNESNG
ncbi:plasmid mobilization relaxosome protein MobC [Erwinia amylovora]|uniref:plasmid mobilization relaxosome protein MobC n=1 Tax=Erwinia amylovora TaxID=552 RepID=UPI0002C8DBE2|nr:plasmid mobilization relaxosome protein MobC [Erwinia amylovora]CCP05149.1 hypothetical protein BN440_0083 [Erwinia amylovora MR1]